MKNITKRSRANSEMRPLKITRKFTKFSPGSVLIEFGDTKVICTATIENKVPFFLKDKGQGWLTAEYALLPSATQPRASREVKRGKQSGRTNEIQRIIGRSLRTIIDLQQLGERTIAIDTDVIQADGGTRTAAITGSMVALWDSIQHLIKNGELDKNPIREFLAAISVGIVENEILCDLCYEEDSNADVDLNVVMTENQKLIEIQGTAEKMPFSRDQLDEMLLMAQNSISKTISELKEAVGV